MAAVVTPLVHSAGHAAAGEAGSTFIRSIIRSNGSCNDNTIPVDNAEAHPFGTPAILVLKIQHAIITLYDAVSNPRIILIYPNNNVDAGLLAVGSDEFFRDFYVGRCDTHESAIRLALQFRKDNNNPSSKETTIIFLWISRKSEPWDIPTPVKIPARVGPFLAMGYGTAHDVPLVSIPCGSSCTHDNVERPASKCAEHWYNLRMEKGYSAPLIKGSLSGLSCQLLFASGNWVAGNGFMGIATCLLQLAGIPICAPLLPATLLVGCISGVGLVVHRRLNKKYEVLNYGGYEALEGATEKLVLCN
jgi:hypothetical protein